MATGTGAGEDIPGVKAAGTGAVLAITGMKVTGCKPAAAGDGTVVTGNRKQLLILRLRKIADFEIAGF